MNGRLTKHPFRNWLFGVPGIFQYFAYDFAVEFHERISNNTSVAGSVFLCALFDPLLAWDIPTMSSVGKKQNPGCLGVC